MARVLCSERILKELPPRPICGSDEAQWDRGHGGPKVIAVPNKVTINPSTEVLTNHQVICWLKQCGFNSENLNQTQTFSHRRLTPLLYASELGKLSVCQYLLDHGASVNDVSDTGSCALFYAAGFGHLSVAKLLFKQGKPTDIFKTNNFGATPFDFAASNGHINILSWLVAVGGEKLLIRRDFDGYSPLFLACRKGKLSAAKWIYNRLDQKGTDIIKGQTDSQGCSLFISTFLMGKLDVCVWLISEGFSEVILATHGRMMSSASFRARNRFHEKHREQVIENRAALLVKVSEAFIETLRFKRTFLVGTLSSSKSLIAQSMSGLEGVRMMIADFVGIHYGDSLKQFQNFIFRQSTASD